MLKKKILLLGLFLAGSVAGLKAQDTPTAFGCEFKGAPAGFTWSGDSQGFPHVSTFEALKYYKEELSRVTLHSGSTTNRTVSNQLTRKINSAKDNFEYWKTINPEPQRTKKETQTITEGTKAWNAYIAASDSLNKGYNAYLFMRNSSSANNISLGVYIAGLNSKVAAVAGGYGLTLKQFKPTDEIEVDMTKDLNLYVLANRYESNDNVGQPLNTSIQEVGKTAALTVAEMNKAWQGRNPTIKEFLQLLRDKALFKALCVTGTKEFYTTVLNPDYSSEKEEWEDNALPYEVAIETAEENLTSFYTNVGRLYLDGSFTIPESFTFADVYNSAAENNLDNYKISHIWGQRRILTMEVRGSLLGTNRYTEVNMLGIKGGALRTSVTGDKSFHCFDNPNEYDDGNSVTWRATDDKGNLSETPGKYPEAQMGYTTRKAFGLKMYDESDESDIEAREFVPSVEASGSSAYRVFKVVYYDYARKDYSEKEQTFYTNLNEEGQPVGTKAFCSQLGYDPNGNGFIYVLDDDAAQFRPATGRNVVYIASRIDDEPIWACKNADFNFGKNHQYYIWKDFTAEKLSYKREFTSSPTLVCLPFNLERADVDSMTNDGHGVNGGIIKLMNFDGYHESYKTDGEYLAWFRYTEKLPANQPGAIRFAENYDGPSNSVFFGSMENRKVVATPSLTEGVLTFNDYSSTADGKTRYGSLNATYGGGEANNLGNEENRLYVFVKGQLRRVANDNTTYINPGVAYIQIPQLGNIVSANANKLAVGYIDEWGEEVEDGGQTTGVTEVGGQTFKATGATHAIRIESSNACAVKIYTPEGKLINQLNVAAGTTMVEVNAGVYIVNGKKVIVK